ncbi:hypothetical protein [Streptomyces avidinii]|uniref:Uncharacterized protein n=1 Tax=Streptomyces avidinii TaxID=1895 RepID=A0ABS4L6U8_STRAV|nr:hypothetical protein [Streptomyces avidinii]MBP2037826.1 hypothetical protein [Streptomyces avidinii]
MTSDLGNDKATGTGGTAGPGSAQIDVNARKPGINGNPGAAH